MIGTIVQNGLYAYYRIGGKRSGHNSFRKALFNGREIVLRNGAAYYLFFKYITGFHIA